MSPIYHIAHLQPLFKFLATPECNYCILHAHLVLPSSLFDNVTFRHMAFLAFPFEQRSQEIFEGYLGFLHLEILKVCCCMIYQQEHSISDKLKCHFITVEIRSGTCVDKAL
jgi:hypothetical protein